MSCYVFRAPPILVMVTVSEVDVWCQRSRNKVVCMQLAVLDALYFWSYFVARSIRRYGEYRECGESILVLTWW